MTDGDRRRRPKVEGPLPPSRPELPDVALLAEDLPVALRGAKIRARHLSTTDLSGCDATGARLIECRVDDVDLSGAVIRRASIGDTVVERGDWANVDAFEAELKRVNMHGVRLTGATLAATKISDVRFVDCRINLSSVRFGHLERVTFENCSMEEVDFYEATLSSVVFSGCDLTKANLAKATFARCEMRDCELGGVGGPEQLRGVGMPWSDVVGHAAVLALGLGVRILDDD